MFKKIDIYILKSLAVSFFISFFIISAVMIIGDVIKIYDIIFASGSSLRRILNILLYITLFLSIFSIPMALTIAINYVYSEMSNSSEITAIRSSGISLARVYLPSLIFTFAVFVFLVYDIAFLAPKARFHYKDELVKAFRNKIYMNLKPSTFYKNLGGVMWMGSISADHKHLTDVFFSNKNDVFVSKKGVLKDTYNGILADFLSVKAYSEKKSGWEFGSFKDYEVSFALKEINKKPSGVRYMTIAKLIGYYKKTKDRDALYKINKMISMSLSVFSLSLIAFSFGITFSRSGKSAGIVVSLFLFFGLYVLLALAGSLFDGYGVIFPVYAPSVFMFFVGLYMFYRKIKV
ncbi:LptF/LptG family permease [Hippea alviniae]|uniref:LptF/LptG family permease n=1 Tax=Hippea alviniae TaxID=1279027 RepID=UPI0003B36A0C|nr:LptF/LptG family permease [Hippea alviniae]